MNALIVLNYNDSNTTINFVKQSASLEQINKIIVVDNHSTDKSYTNLTKLKNKKVTVLLTDKNNGYATGNNYGIKYAINKFNADTLVIANPDVQIPSQTLNLILNFLKNNKFAGAVTGRMICPPNIKNPIGWKLPKYNDCLMENFFAIKKIIGSNILYPDSFWNKDICKVDVVPGSFFCIKSETFQNIGFFDEGTFLYYEENILGYKLKKNGYENYVLMNAPYFHNHSVSINKSISSNKKKLEIEQQSRKLYCKKYLKINKVQEKLLDTAFSVGLFDYLLYCKISGK